MHDDEGTLISEMLTLTALLGGRMERYETLNSVGRSSKKIVIEYDIKVKIEDISIGVLVKILLFNLVLGFIFAGILNSTYG